MSTFYATTNDLRNYTSRPRVVATIVFHSLIELSYRESLLHRATHFYGFAVVDAKRSCHEELDTSIDALLDLESGWDGYSADPPAPRALGLARDLISRLKEANIHDYRVAASAEGGVSIIVSGGKRYGYIECLNSGEVLAALSDRQAEPIVWEVKQSEDGYTKSLKRIREYVGA